MRIEIILIFLLLFSCNRPKYEVTQNNIELNFQESGSMIAGIIYCDIKNQFLGGSSIIDSNDLSAKFAVCEYNDSILLLIVVKDDLLFGKPKIENPDYDYGWQHWFFDHVELLFDFNPNMFDYIFDNAFDEKFSFYLYDSVFATTKPRYANILKHNWKITEDGYSLYISIPKSFFSCKKQVGMEIWIKDNDTDSLSYLKTGIFKIRESELTWAVNSPRDPFISTTGYGILVLN